MIETFRKIPVEVQATQWTGENWEELIDFTDNKFDYAHFGLCEDNTRRAGVYDELHTTWVQLTIGDYIIRGIAGEFYPCNEAVFLKTYEKIGTYLTQSMIDEALSYRIYVE